MNPCRVAIVSFLAAACQGGGGRGAGAGAEAGAGAAVPVLATLDTVSIAGLEVTALPFDPDRILDSLTTAAPRPQPSFPELEEMLARYRRPDLGLFREVSGPLRELRDSVERLADSLNRADRRLPAYASRYARFRRMYGRLAQRAGERDAQWRQMSGDELQLARRAQQAADSLRAWEEEAFAAYAELTAQATIREGRAVHGDTTDADGAVILRLEPGSWWIVARWLDPDNPFQEFYWSVPIRTTSWLPLRVPLARGNTVRRWRH